MMKRALKPNAQPFDEIRIITVPRYKQSDLSGDEWRISALTLFLRNGEVKAERAWGSNVENALHASGFHYLDALDDGKGRFVGEGHYCDQEGCRRLATHAFGLRKGYNRDGSERKLDPSGEYRLFCEEHSKRGDCGLEDSDKNYYTIKMSEIGVK